MPTLSRNAQVLRFILQVAPGIGHTKLAKFAYLADLEARKYLGHPVSEFRYIRDQRGPFDAHGFFGACQELIRKGYIIQNRIDYFGYPAFEMLPTDLVPDYDFSDPEEAVLDHVAKAYVEKTARELCDDVVYKTEPMKDAKLGKRLPMGKVTLRRKARHEFSLERMLAGEASVKARRTRLLADVLNGVRNRVG